jgi:hypothetical protein
MWKTVESGINVFKKNCCFDESSRKFTKAADKARL